MHQEGGRRAEDVDGAGGDQSIASGFACGDSVETETSGSRRAQIRLAVADKDRIDA